MEKKTRVTRKITYPARIVEALNKLEINDTFNKKVFIKENWGDYDFYTSRSFDVALSAARKILDKKKFVSRDKMIRRVW